MRRQEVSKKRRDFRRDPGLPETEIPRRTHTKGKNKKHVHNYEKVYLGQKVRAWVWWTNDYMLVDTYIHICRGCGNRRNYYWG